MGGEKNVTNKLLPTHLDGFQTSILFRGYNMHNITVVFDRINHARPDIKPRKR